MRFSLKFECVLTTQTPPTYFNPQILEVASFNRLNSIKVAVFIIYMYVKTIIFCKNLIILRNCM